MEDLIRSVALITEPESLHANIAGRLKEIAGCELATLCQYESGADAYVATFSTWQDGAEVRQIRVDVNGTLAKWLRVNEKPLVVPDGSGIFEYLDEDERRVLSELSIRVCVPLFAVNRLIGVVMLGSRNDEWRITGEDLQLLNTCGRHAALACENAGLYRFERERLQSMYRAEQLVVAGQLAASIAHEVRNPLTAIRSTIQYALESTGEWSTKQQLLQEALSEVDRIETTIAGILSLSRPHQLELEPIDVAEIIEWSLTLVHAYAESCHVSTIVDMQARPLPVLGDARELRQVFVNLFLNACQAMTDGGRLLIRSDITLGPDPSNTRPLAVVEVIDSGCGISPEEIDKVFNPFFTTKRAGTGLGLAICLEIVSRHDGRIRLDSQPGEGTVARIELPLRSVFHGQDSIG